MSLVQGLCFARAAIDKGVPGRYGQVGHKARGDESNDSGLTAREAGGDKR
jgi:hypothetical protein